MEMKGNPFTINHRDSLEPFLLPIPATLGFPGLEVLVPKEIILLLDDTKMIPPQKLRLPPGCFGFVMPLNQQARRMVALIHWGD